MAKNKIDKDDPAIQAASMKRQGPQRLRQQYMDQARPEVTKQFGVTNPMAMPVLDRIVLNVNMGRFLDGPKLPPNIRATVLETLTQISGQKPIVVKAKKSVSNFKVREGMETAAMVTLRGDRMWDFLDRFINLATPRIKDFRGLSETAFDKAGNYSLGLTEQGVFPEINMANVNFTHGMNINFVFRNSDKAKSRAVLESLGMPFRKPTPPKKKAS
jgi:large subunit ribosomal protein L5